MMPEASLSMALFLKPRSVSSWQLRHDRISFVPLVIKGSRDLRRPGVQGLFGGRQSPCLRAEAAWVDARRVGDAVKRRDHGGRRPL
jgi:hypothetical protein